jgi:glutaredoxin-like protein
MIDDKLKQELKGMFAKELSGNVKLWLFTSSNKEECPYCEATAEMAAELAGVDARISLFQYTVEDNAKEAKVMGIERAPALLIQGEKAHSVYYYGIPAGYEFSSLVEDIIDVSKGSTRLAERTKEAVRKIDRNVDIKVFVTPTCPYCPRAVRIAHQMAIENSRITASMIEAGEFEQLSGKYGVMAVPKVVINDRVSFEGALPEEQFLSYIRQAVA